MEIEKSKAATALAATYSTTAPIGEPEIFIAINFALRRLLAAIYYSAMTFRWRSSLTLSLSLRRIWNPFLKIGSERLPLQTSHSARRSLSFARAHKSRRKGKNIFMATSIRTNVLARGVGNRRLLTKSGPSFCHCLTFSFCVEKLLR